MPDLDDIKKRYGIIGHDARLLKALQTVLMVASSDLSVLIEGESGTGKEVLPRVVHDHSSRKTSPYLAINCGSIPEGTIDSELFGHEKGAFTDAIGEHAGYFEAADGGTLFLDEVGELPLSTQARLLRVLETGEYMRVGGNRTLRTNVRVVAATNVALRQAISEGRFRADLFYRLSGVTVTLPPLRERGDDVLKLFRHFAILSARAYRKAESLRLTPEAERLVVGYSWPGNIRQLRNLVEQMSVVYPDATLATPEMLRECGLDERPTELVGPIGTTTQGETLERTVAALQQMVYQLYVEVQQMKAYMGVPATSAQPAQPQPSLALTYDLPAPNPEGTGGGAEPIEAEEIHDDTLNLEQLERATIERALRKYRNRRNRAAEELGISARTLYRKIKQYDIDE